MTELTHLWPQLLHGLHLVLAAAAILAVLPIARHFFFSMVTLARSPKRTPDAVPRTRFVVMIPAHDEEKNIRTTIQSALQQDYPKDRVRVVVLADNCTDGTATVAREMGVEVMERTNLKHPGKGKAIAWFIDKIEWEKDMALVCFDADSEASPDYLRQMNAGLVLGVAGVQGYNGAKDPGKSALASLSYLTNTMKNSGTYFGRYLLGLPVPMMNGWCLSGTVIREHGWRSFSITEDFEHTLRLASEGIFMRFAPYALIRSSKARSFKTATKQRRRWSGGESQLASAARRLLWQSLFKRNTARLHLALDVLWPGYATNAAYLILLAIMGYVAQNAAALGLSFVGLWLLLLTTMIGFYHAGADMRLLRGVVISPVFIVWKLALAVTGSLHPPRRWERADR
ncbi:MAG: glycosyltransferase [Deltaproteobacteria bacterium]|nr:glycosyltransferase [bacterium]MCB9479777.1 glycosyltransferase [Deltaproteobacteria bacterium]MCB9487547.1 glycosyltransferase [Deltaproteobacteria bacterium]